MRSIPVICLLFTSYFVAAQVVPYTRYTTHDGMSVDRINTITQDHKGFMWFGSFYGIDNYDGKSFSAVPLPAEKLQKFVSSLITIADKLYVSFSYTGTLEEYSRGRLNTVIAKLKNSGVDENFVLSPTADSGLIVAYSNACFKFRKGTPEMLFQLANSEHPKDFLQSIVQISAHSVAIATTGGLLFYSNKNGKWIHESTILHHQRVTNLYKDAKQRIWISYKSNNQSKIALLHKDKTLKDLYAGELYDAKYNSRTSDHYWAVDKQKGLMSVSAEGRIAFYPGVVNLLSYVSYVFADRENNVWISNDPGVIKFTPLHSRTYPFQESAARESSLQLIDDRLITTSMYSLYMLNNGHLKKLNHPVKDVRYTLKPLVVNGKLWVQKGDGGIWLCDLRDKIETRKLFMDPVDGKSKIHFVVSDQKDVFWLSSDHNIIEIRNQKITQSISIRKLLGEDAVIFSGTFDPVRKCLWLGGDGTGLYQVGLVEAQGKYEYRLLKHFKQPEGLPNLYVRGLLVDTKGDLWVGTRFSGVYKLKDVNGKFQMESFQQVKGLNRERVIEIAEEKGESVFFATCDGIYRYTYTDQKWKHFGVTNGLPNAEVHAISINTKKKKLYAATIEGITELDYDDLEQKLPPPIVSLTNISVLGRSDTAALYVNDVIEYSADQNSIEFSFSGPTFLNEKKTMYKYILEGFTNQWSEPNATSSVTYAALPPGSYTFKVMAANAEGTWSTAPAIFRFELVLPFYKTTWFYLLMLFTAGAILYSIHTYRLKQKVKFEKLRLNIARDLHDDIGSALGSINLLTKTAKRKLQATGEEELLGTFDRIGKSAQNTLDSMDDIIWSINPDKDNWQDLLIRMKEFAIPLAEANDIKLHINIDAAEYDKLPMEWRRNIFLIFKEAISNCVKHAHCSSIEVHSTVENSRFKMTIKDDGQGFDVNLKTTRNGIKNIIQRSALLNGVAEVGSNGNEGTTIYIECPLR